MIAACMRQLTLVALCALWGCACPSEPAPSERSEPPERPAPRATRSAEEQAPRAPETAQDIKPDPEGLKLPDEVDDFIRDRMRQVHLPGLTAAIVMDGRVAWTGAYGLAHIKEERRATPDTPFLMASVSKTVTAVAVMQQVEAGRIDLDQDINDLLPFRVRHPEAPRAPITPRMLMTHTSGIEDNWDVMERFYAKGDSPEPLERFLRDYLTPKGRHYRDHNFGESPPGEEHSYTNIGTALLGLLVESVTRSPFDRYCHDAIFAPLGMTRTSWMLRDLDPRQVATPYGWTGVRLQANAHYGVPDYPSGQLRSSARDMGRFLAMITREGRGPSRRVLKARTVRDMLKAQIPEIDTTQALIWGREEDGDDVLLGHEGSERGATTQMFFRLEDGLGYVLLANGSDESDEGDEDEDAQAEALTEIGTLLLEEAEQLAP